MGCGDSKKLEDEPPKNIIPQKNIVKEQVIEQPLEMKQRSHKELQNLAIPNLYDHKFTNEELNHFQAAEDYFEQKNSDNEENCDCSSKQEIILDLEDANQSQLKAWGGFLTKRAKQILKLKLSLYENKALTKDLLGRLNQADNEWCQYIAEALNGRVLQLEQLEISLCTINNKKLKFLGNNKKVNDEGFKKILKAIKNQKQLTSLKLFLSNYNLLINIYILLEGSGCTNDGAGKQIERFIDSQKNSDMKFRIKGAGLNVNTINRM